MSLSIKLQSQYKRMKSEAFHAIRASMIEAKIDRIEIKNKFNLETADEEVTHVGVDEEANAYIDTENNSDGGFNRYDVLDDNLHPLDLIAILHSLGK